MILKAQKKCLDALSATKKTQLFVNYSFFCKNQEKNNDYRIFPKFTYLISMHKVASFNLSKSTIERGEGGGGGDGSNDNNEGGGGGGRGGGHYGL